MERKRNRLQQEPKRKGESQRDCSLHHDKRLFALMDKYLDTGRYGPRWLKEPRFAQIVEDALFFYADRLYILWAYVIMANHVHVFLTPKRETNGQTRMFASLTDAEGFRSAPHQTGISNQRQTEMSAPRNVLLRRITKGLKGYTAREINKLLDRTGQSFWQDESFDHWARDESGFYRVVDYIENNPVNAGLVNLPEEWRWSSAWFRKKHGIQGIQPLLKIE
ncbi:hypothetical protein FJZ31_20575 [Candidatus Poribacteria bacterium]|nr:hypothetical protein [Candidatus Poribacteria bacterium]